MARHYLEVLSDTIRENWNEIALADYRTLTRYTFGDLADNMANLGNIYDQLKLKKGVHVAICGNNCANWAVAYLGTAVWGGVNVCVMPDFQAEDIAARARHHTVEAGRTHSGVSSVRVRAHMCAPISRSTSAKSAYCACGSSGKDAIPNFAKIPGSSACLPRSTSSDPARARSSSV